MSALIYQRTSTSKQDCSLSIQEERCKLHAQMLGLEVYKVIEDKETGTSFKREGIQEIKDIIGDKNENGITHLICYKLDRMGRDLMGILEFVEYLKGKGISLVSTSESVDYTSPQGALTLQLLSAFSQFEVSCIKSRTSEALQKKKRTGKKYTRIVPFGKTLVDGEYIDNAEEQEAISIILDRRNSGIGYPTIAKELKDKGFETRQGGEWKFYSVRAIYLRVTEELKQVA